MSSFVAFRLVSELRQEGFAPSKVSLATTARACAKMGALSLAELVGIDLAKAPEMSNVPEHDRCKLQARNWFSVRRVAHTYLQFCQELINRKALILLTFVHMLTPLGVRVR
jgi:hypothetical protein